MVAHRILDNFHQLDAGLRGGDAVLVVFHRSQHIVRFNASDQVQPDETPVVPLGLFRLGIDDHSLRDSRIAPR